MEKEITNSISDLPFFDLEINYEMTSNSVIIIGNSLALEHIISACQELLRMGKSGRHHHFSQGVEGTIGNVKELTIMKR